jgi:hypothetical protein
LYPEWNSACVAVGRAGDDRHDPVFETDSTLDRQGPATTISETMISEPARDRQPLTLPP